VLLSTLKPHKQKKGKIKNKKNFMTAFEDKKKYWKKIKKIYQWKEYTRIPRKLLKLVEENQTYKIEKFDSLFSTNGGPIGKEKSIWEGKIKIGCLKTQLQFLKVYLNLLRV